MSKDLCRDWSSITWRGGSGATKPEGGGGQVKFYPYKKREGKSFSHTDRGAQKVVR